MQRRTFLCGSAAILAAFGPAPAGAAEPAKSLPLIGVLNPISALGGAPLAAFLLAAFREGLHGQGFVEGKNVRVAYRSADGDYARLPALAAELVRLKPAVIVAAGGFIDPA